MPNMLIADDHPQILSILSDGKYSFDPVPLRQHFEERTLVGFGWDYLEQGPEIWRIRLTRR